MRNFLIIFIALLVSTLATAQSLEKITTISFTKQSRGYLDEVVISKDSVHGAIEHHKAPENSKNYSTDVDDDDWARLMIALKDIALKDIDGLQSPTRNRAHDGAIHSTIVITFDDGSSITHSFDDEKPHPDLQPLLDAILEYRVPN